MNKRSVLTNLLGKLQWTKPAWLIKINLIAKHKPLTLGMVIFLLFGIVLSAYWYANLPKPVLIKSLITIPAVTLNNETLVPNNLLINFGIEDNGFIAQSVAPINLINKVIDEGIELSPKMEGRWFWNGDNQLVFTPTQDWPAGQTYRIHFAKEVFAPKAKIERFDISFTTNPFQCAILEFKFYSDPIHSEQKNAVATLSFNYPVNSESLEKYTQLVFQSVKNNNQTKPEQALKFSYTYDQNKRTAYLHSEPIKIENTTRFLTLTLGHDIKSSYNNQPLSNELIQNLEIPDSSHILTISTTQASIVRNSQDRPEQVLTIETSIGVNETEFNKAIQLYLLPQDYPASAAEQSKMNYKWQNPGEVTSKILALATPITTTPIASEQNYSSLHSFKFSAQTPRFLYIKINQGMKGFGGFALQDNYTAVIPVPELPKEISFLHKGSLLALSDDKKLSVLIRGLPAVKFEFARVLPANINQLITQTEGDFNNPHFINPSFNQQNISQIFTDIQQFDAHDLTKQQYAALDLGQYLAANNQVSGPEGLFLLQATGWDVGSQSPLDVKASRLILITDLGLLVKDNLDGTHDLFVESITQGIPAVGVTVTLLGKNGLPLLTRVTDAQGRVSFPNLNDFVDDKAPTVYLASLNHDVSFIPFNNQNRHLNFSKFDVGGIYTQNQELQSLSAFIFSDRGIYRPGDTVHVGMIVKQAYARSQPAGLPLQVIIRDSRGNTVKDQRITLNETGYLDLDFNTQPTSPTGEYSISLYLVKDNSTQNLLGSSSIKLSEFQPDRMRISSQLILPHWMDGAILQD